MISKISQKSSYNNDDKLYETVNSISSLNAEHAFYSSHPCSSFAHVTLDKYNPTVSSLSFLLRAYVISPTGIGAVAAERAKAVTYV